RQIDALVEVEEEKADPRAEVMRVGPDEDQQAELGDRHRQVAAHLRETLLGREARIEQVEQPCGEREEEQRAGDAVQSRDPGRRRQANLEQERGQAQVFRTWFLRGRAGHLVVPGPDFPPRCQRIHYSVATQQPAAVKSKSTFPARSSRCPKPPFASPSPAPQARSAIRCSSGSRAARCSEETSR